MLRGGPRAQPQAREDSSRALKPEFAQQDSETARDQWFLFSFNVLLSQRITPKTAPLGLSPHCLWGADNLSSFTCA